ncbi:hypothetical protein YC2023_032104 [Brassica napus]
MVAVKVTTSGMASSHSVTGGVYKARERIHRERPNELGFPYLAGSFRGKRIIYDEKYELQENDSEFLQSGTMQYQRRDSGIDRSEAKLAKRHRGSSELAGSSH